MDITSLSFLFIFLPFSLVIAHLVGNRFIDFVLLILSLIFYSFGSFTYLSLFVGSIILTILLGRTLSKISNIWVKRILLIIGICIHIGILGYYKYTDFAILTISSIFHNPYPLKNLVLPLGISFFTFKSISYLADAYTNTIQFEKNPIHDALYLSFFAQIVSGPLSRYNEMKPLEKEERKQLFENGVYRFIIGFNKKILLANILFKITSEIFSTPLEQFSTSYAWLGSICFSLQLFFDFAGYSDMAIGITNMFGYRCQENFHFPYMTESISKFWRRWHISLSSWFRDYIYIPLGGSRTKKSYQVYFNLLAVWLFTGIWHGASWNFVAWGLGYFVMISFERFTNLPNRLQSKISKLIYRIFTLLFINFEWVLFNSPSLVNGLRYIKRMIIYTPNTLMSTRTLFLIKDYSFFLFFAILFSFPIVPWIESKVQKNNVVKMVYDISYSIIVFILFVWAISFIISGQNNPFAYANF